MIKYTHTQCCIIKHSKQVQNEINQNNYCIAVHGIVILLLNKRLIFSC